MKKVVITGGLGYLGGRLSSKLLDTGMEVRALSRRNPPASLLGTDTARSTVVCDYSSSSLETAFSGCDTVVHLAAMNEIECKSDPYKAIEFNVAGTQRVIDAAMKTGIENLVFLSTAHVYGAPLLGKITESKLPHPVHPYATTHRAAEDLVYAAGVSGKIHTSIIRMSNSFGPPLNPEVNRWTLVCNDLCRQLIEKRQIILNTSGIQVRDFITLTDAVNAIKFIGENSESYESGAIFNLGGKLSMSVRAIAEDISKIYEGKMGESIPVQAPEPKPGETAGYLDFDIGKLEALGYSLGGKYYQELSELIDFCGAHFAK